jgi:glutamine---fructose-6-phosphate transaminase (isomerizing)
MKRVGMGSSVVGSSPMRASRRKIPIRTEVREGGYVADILDQPRAIEETARALDVSPELRSIARGLARGGFARVVLTGMGSSFHALHPLHLDLVGRGFPSILVETSDLLFHQAALLRRPALLVVVSQSGASVEVVRLLRRIPKGVEVIGVTNTPDSALAKRAGVVLLTRAGREFSVSCKTYVAALLALAWLSGVLRGEDPDVVTTDLRQAAPAVSRYLRHWHRHVAALRSAFKGIRSLFLVGRGASLAAVGVGGLIIKESAHVHAEGMSSPAFRHGPFEILSARTWVGVFLGDASTASLNRLLCSDVVRAGGRAAIIGGRESRGPFYLPEAPARIRPILEMLPVEMISLALAANQGREAGKFELASKITTIE